VLVDATDLERAACWDAGARARLNDCTCVAPRVDRSGRIRIGAHGSVGNRCVLVPVVVVAGAAGEQRRAEDQCESEKQAP
jgi:hypothetical protein